MLLHAIQENPNVTRHQLGPFLEKNGIRRVVLRIRKISFVIIIMILNRVFQDTHHVLACTNGNIVCNGSSSSLMMIAASSCW